ncbi:hypothetical protein DIURU_005433 [Diutina rugosa]|uniref:Polynucleotide 5'-hydroxyl-kinase GRC3 n=1 Tax=Diutina rugosa TaxID=5481 RepID=A0A642UH22_DIURU|nr:uncharacterized protein DIURU_005433 [Diutina rugosa]KAA8896920.1 hypothetical protein DIURU_005433 [Diutina rugosa]
MSIPGINDVGPATDTSTPIASAATRIIVPAGNEWRIEVPFRKQMTVTVLEGVAEVFGTELAPKVEYKFSGVKYAIYAPLESVTLEYTVSNSPESHRMALGDDDVVEYLSNETTSDQVTNLALYLETLRQKAHDGNARGASPRLRGPRVLVLGPHGAGKTAVAKTLVSYAVKMGSTPVLVNLNPRDGVFSVPGSLTATTINDSLDIEAAGGWGFTPTSGSLPHNPKQPLVKNFGFSAMGDNRELYNYQTSKLGVAVMSRLEHDPRTASAGVVIDTPPELGGNNLSSSFATIENIISDFEVDHLVVIGNERLFVDLKHKLKRKIDLKSLTTIKLPRSGGSVDVDDSFVRQAQEESIREYFNGNSRAHLQPLKTDIDGAALDVYKGVEASDLSSSLAFLPSGDDYSNDSEPADSLDKYYRKLETADLQKVENTLVAISHVPQLSYKPKDVLNTSVKGYIYVAKVDNQKLKVLLPFPAASLPKNVMLATGIGYTE